MIVNWFLNLLVCNVIERKIEREKVQMKPPIVMMANFTIFKNLKILKREFSLVKLIAFLLEWGWRLSYPRAHCVFHSPKIWPQKRWQLCVRDVYSTLAVIRDWESWLCCNQSPSNKEYVYASTFLCYQYHNTEGSCLMRLLGPGKIRISQKSH